jgi:hypothetical protein
MDALPDAPSGRSYLFGHAEAVDGVGDARQAAQVAAAREALAEQVGRPVDRDLGAGAFASPQSIRANSFKRTVTREGVPLSRNGYTRVAVCSRGARQSERYPAQVHVLDLCAQLDQWHLLAADSTGELGGRWTSRWRSGQVALRD